MTRGRSTLWGHVTALHLQPQRDVQLEKRTLVIISNVASSNILSIGYFNKLVNSIAPYTPN